jgi:phosphosulfolactate synthase
VLSFDHEVTQWMSTVIVSLGRSTNSSQLQLRSPISNLHSSSGTRGVGPADNTGKPGVRYWPGGSAASAGDSARRRRNPRVMGMTAVSRIAGDRRRGTTMTVVAPDFLALPERTAKPRRAGITHVLDRGLSPLALESLLETAGEHIDLIKLGWGTAYVSRGVKDKVSICREAGVGISLGGTLLEIAREQGRVEHYLEWLRELGIDHVEVSNGSLPIAPEDKRALISHLAGEFTVIAEVGSKRSLDAIAEEWVAEMLGDLAAGAALVIAEGRESGTVGLFDATGAVHAELVEAILHAVGREVVIFEAPLRSQQTWLLQHVGPNVNLGNIKAEDVIALETLRRGLRFETLDLLPSAVRP